MINPAHKFAVYEYLDTVTDPFYIGKRFISGNGKPGKSTKIVATADTVEECQKHIPEKLGDLAAWLIHLNAQTNGALGRMLTEDDS